MEPLGLGACESYGLEIGEPLNYPRAGAQSLDEL